MARQRVVPMIDYEDVATAIDWLCDVLGFAVHHLVTEEDGRVSFAELAIGGDGMISVWHGGDGYLAPDHHAEVCDHARRWLDTPYIVDGLLVYVDDVRAHHDRAEAKGARILTHVEEGFPSTRYRVADLEGHRWMFMQSA